MLDQSIRSTTVISSDMRNRTLSICNSVCTSTVYHADKRVEYERFIADLPHHFGHCKYAPLTSLPNLRQEDRALSRFNTHRDWLSRLFVVLWLDAREKRRRRMVDGGMGEMGRRKALQASFPLGVRG